VAEEAGQGARGRGGAPANVNAVTAGEFLIDPPTLINLGFEWFIQGDENRNAAVTVSYRKKGESVWKDALPLLRLKGERVYMASQVDVISPNMFAGSILDLEPDTAYEAQFVLSDPDGVRGVQVGRSLSGLAGTQTVRRWSCLSRLSSWIHRTENRTVIRRADVRVQLLLRWNGLGYLGQTPRQAGRHDPRARRTVQVQPLRVHQ
jgi:hypothetical protein